MNPTSKERSPGVVIEPLLLELDNAAYERAVSGHDKDARTSKAKEALRMEFSRVGCELEAARTEVARYALLKRAVNESAGECLPTCDSIAHDDQCPVVNGAKWLEALQGEVESLRAFKRRADEALPKLEEFMESWRKTGPGYPEYSDGMRRRLTAMGLLRPTDAAGSAGEA